MILDTIIILLVIVAYLSREKTAIFFVALVVLFTFLSDAFATTPAILDGWCYFVTGSVIDVLFIATVSLFAKPSQINTNLLYISFCSILLNAYGALLWSFSYSLVPYDNGFVALYVLAILTINRRQGARININNLFRSANYKSFLLY